MEISWRNRIDLSALEAAQLEDLAARSKSAPFADLEVLQAWSTSMASTDETLAGFAFTDNRLCGLLVIARQEDRTDAWRLWGDNVDFGIIWADPAHALRCWADWLIGLREHGVESVLLRNLRMADPVVSAMFQAVSQPPVDLELLDRRRAPFVDLSTGHEGWLEARSASQRRQYRRAHRRFLTIPDLDLRLSERGDDLTQTLDVFFELHRERRGELGKSTLYHDPVAVHFLQTLVKLWSPTGRVRALTACSGPRVVGVELILATERTWYSLNGGWSPEFARFHVGTGLLIEAMQAARRHGARRYSLLEGEEPYKIRMADGGHQLTSWRLVLTADQSAPVS
jgi:CelD/BcsL family acetyltransferase involved in cellulose biosynthesis